MDATMLAGNKRKVRVVLLHRLVIAAARLQNAVLGSGQFELQLAEIFVRFQVRIILHHDQEPAQRAVELVVGGDLLLGGSGPAQRGTGIRNGLNHGGFFLRVTL